MAGPRMATSQLYRTDPMPTPTSLARLAAIAGLACAFSGCAVVTVAGAAASVAVTAGSLAVDAAVGTVKITGKAVGLAADAVLPGDSKN
jgi:hypothetical protein